MKIIRDVPGARRLPSRRRFALARLIALMRFGRNGVSQSADIDSIVVAIERDQNAAEVYSVAIWISVTVALYIAAVLPLPFGWALAAGILLAPIAVQIPMFIVGALLVPLWNLATGAKAMHNEKLNSVVFMTLMVIASSYFGTIASPVRYVAWFFFTVFLLNVAAWLILLPLRGRIRELERQCGL